MKQLVLGAVLVCAASALQADNKFYRAQPPLPPEVEKRLPADIPLRDVLVQDGCYYYLYEGKVYPVPASPNIPGAYCVG